MPVIGLLVSSFRERLDIQTSPWWHVLPHRLGGDEDDLANSARMPMPMTVGGITAPEEMRAGVRGAATDLIGNGGSATSDSGEA
jgi:hypothetical protein